MTDIPHLFEADALRGVGLVGLWLFATRDDAGTILYASPALERFFGYEMGGLGGKGIEALVPEGLRELHKANRLAYNADPAAGRADGDGIPVIGLRRDGSEVSLVVGLACYRTPPPTVLDLIYVTVLRRTDPRIHPRSPLPESRGLGAGLVGLALATLLMVGLPTPAGPNTTETPHMAAKSSFADGLAAMDRREYAEAVAEFSAAKTPSPKSTAALAECYYYLGRYDDALAACDRLRNAESCHVARGHFIRGLVWRRQGREADARREFVRAAALGDGLAATRL